MIKFVFKSFLLIALLLNLSCATSASSIASNGKKTPKKKVFSINGQSKYGGFKVWCLVNKKYDRLLLTRMEHNYSKIAYTIIFYNKDYYVVTSDVHPRTVSLDNSTNLLEQYRKKEIKKVELMCEDELVRVYGSI